MTAGTLPAPGSRKDTMTYQLSARGGPPRGFPVLRQAMAAAGHPDADDWAVAFGIPGKIFALQPGGSVPDWVIEAPGVAHELVDAACSGGCPRVTWTGNDRPVLKAIAAGLRASAAHLPGGCKRRAAGRIAGHYAAAGEVTWTRIAAAVRSAYDSSCFGFAAAAGEAAAAEITGRLRGAGVVVYDDRLREDTVRDLIDPGAASCRLRLGGSPAGEHGTLAAAMAAAGHLAFRDWRVRPGCPGRLVLAVAGRPAVIKARGVARRFAEAYPPDLLAARLWSGADERIIASVVGVCGPAAGLPYTAAVRAGARLAALHATGGLATADVFATVVDAYDRIGVVLLPRAADAAAAGIAARLAEARVAVAGYRTARAGIRGLAAAWLAAAAWRLPAPARMLAAAAAIRMAGRPRVITVPAGRLPAAACRIISDLANYCVIPAAIAAAGIAATCWSGPRPAWVGWVLAGLVPGVLADVRLLPASSPRSRR